MHIPGDKQFCVGFNNLVVGWTGDRPTPDYRPNFEEAIRRAAERGFKSTKTKMTEARKDF